MAELIQLRSKTSKTYELPNGKHKFVGGLAPLHYGVDNAPINFTPQATTTPLDGWKVDQSDYTYSLGRKAGQDGWFGFGGLEGQNTIFFRLARMGYIHWPSKSFDNLSGTPSYNRANLTSTVENFDTGEELLPVATKASWGNIWNTPNGGEVSIDVNANGERLKLDVILNQAGREWVAANRPPTTRINSTYFGMVFQLDLTDIPKIVRNGITQGQDADFDDLDDLPTELRDDLDNLLAFMPVDYAYAGVGVNEQKVKLTKRFWLDGDGNHYLLVGAKVAQINSLPAGDIRFDPTFGAAQVAVTTRDGNEYQSATWYESGLTGNGNVVGGYINYLDMGMSWDNVTVPNAATISSATIEPYITTYEGSGADLISRMQGFDVDDVAVFSSTNRPSTITQTTATIDRTYSYSTEYAVGFFALDDASTIIQEIVDRAGWASGNALGVAFKDNGTTSGEAWYFQDYGNSTANAAKITIVYTTGGGGATGKSNPIYGPLGGPIYGVIS